MTQIDQFESIFRAASKNQFEYQDWAVQKVLTISDGSREQTAAFEQLVQKFVSNAFETSPIQWISCSGDDFSSVGELVEKVEQERPDLICSHRNLQIPADEFPYSLGVYIDVLTQATTFPVMLLPHRTQTGDGVPWHDESKTVIAITDHLDGDALIVNSAIKMTSEGGTLFLTHVEDEKSYLRFMNVIDKIAEIDSETAHEKIRRRLLLEPENFVASCQAEIARAELNLHVEPIVKMGNSLSDYREIVDSRQVDLVVMHTRDDDQQAMHGLAYPLTIELRETPMLLI